VGSFIPIQIPHAQKESNQKQNHKANPPKGIFLLRLERHGIGHDKH